MVSGQPAPARHQPYVPPGSRPPDAADSPYVRLDRAAWSRLRSSDLVPLTEAELDSVRGLGDEVDLDEVREVYLPLARLLHLHERAVGRLAADRAHFLGLEAPDVSRAPFVLGVAGSVAVGKSTTARLLQLLLSRATTRPSVELVTTDGFLLPNAELSRRGILDRKGFPESYDRRALLRFVRAVKSGARTVTAPVYSHLTYDVVPGAKVVLERPDVVIVEGLNVLQPARTDAAGPAVAVSDFFDFTIYVDASTADIESWYVSRFLRLRETAFQDPSSYFRRYGDLNRTAAEWQARQLWSGINGPNLVENILPTRERADLVLRKGHDHTVTEVLLRKL